MDSGESAASVEEAKEETSTFDLSTDDIIFAFMKDSGALNTYESKEKWHFVVAQPMSAALTFGEPQADRISLQFETVGPAVEELSEGKIISSHICELNFLSNQTCSVFLSAPCPLLQDCSWMFMGIIGVQEKRITEPKCQFRTV
jgi:hypothetical protein